MARDYSNEIYSSCCAIGGLTEEVHVLESDCPIKREEGKRKFVPIGKNEEIVECTCIFISAFGGGVKPCEHYKGIDKVQRNKQIKWKVFCEIKENGGN